MKKPSIIILINLFLFVECNMNNFNEIKKEIRVNSLVIKLYKTKEKKDVQDKPVANIQAFNFQGKLIWTVEPPTYNFSYFDMQIDEDEKILEADSGAGRVYSINLENGYIISSEIIK